MVSAMKKMTQGWDVGEAAVLNKKIMAGGL